MSHRIQADGRSEILSKYYSKLRAEELTLPDDIRMREFAFQLLPDARFVRHLSFSSPEDVVSWIKENIPHSAYYSVGLYQIPGAPNMSEKGIIGAELLFDIDVDHMQECEGKRFKLCDTPDSPELIPRECLQVGLEKAFILKSRVEDEFGIRETRVQFSGNRGFHIIARKEDLLELDGNERKEILDYVSGIGLDLDLLFPRKKGYSRVPPSPAEPGWRGFLAKMFTKLYPGQETDFFKQLEELVEKAIVPVDPQVTVDTSRLIRIPGSINGKSGLIVSILETPEQFNLKRYVPLKEPMLVKVICNVNPLFDPERRYRKNMVYRVDPLTGVSLVFKGVARLLEIGV